MSVITYAALVTEENVDQLVADAAKWHLNVDYLRSEMEDEAEEFGVKIYAILSTNIKYHHATFTTKWEEDFFNNWYFCNGMVYGPYWKEVRLKAERS